jgi:ABC-2 type transport system permease protein
VNGLAVALRVEALAWRRSRVALVVTPLLVLLVPAACVGLVALARSGALVGAGGAKLAGFGTADAATDQLVAAGQVLSVAGLLAGGFAMAAAFGQPLAEGRVGGWFALAVPREAVALARCLVGLAWTAACTTAAALVVAGCAAATTALDPAAVWGGEHWAAAGRAVVAGLLAAGLAVPFAAVATWTRSPLATVGVLIGLVALTQVVVMLGAGAWFPYAVPSLWTGTGGPDAAATVRAAALWLAAAVAPVGATAVVAQWRRLTDV